MIWRKVGSLSCKSWEWSTDIYNSTKDSQRIESSDLIAVEEELCPREGRTISGLAHSLAGAKQDGNGRRMPRTHSAALRIKTNISQQNEVASHLDFGVDLAEGSFPNDERTQKYGNLFFLLQSEPRHIAHLCRLVTMAEIDQILQTVMFTIYGNQYESREEHLLLTMFQVCSE